MAQAWDLSCHRLTVWDKTDAQQGHSSSSRNVISSALYSVRYDLQFRRVTCGGSTNFLKLRIFRGRDDDPEQHLEK